MSYLPKSETGYFDAIQVYFTEVTGKVALFGARDQELLTRWHREGRSARLVCRGIREAVVSMKEGDPPRSLRECERFVDDEWEMAREKSVGRAERGEGSKKREEAMGAAEKTSLVDVISARLIEAGQGATDERFREAYRQGWRRLKTLRKEFSTFELAQVEVLDEVLVAAFYDALRDEEREQLMTSIDAASRGLLAAMSPRAKTEHLRARQKKWMVKTLGLIDVVEIALTR